MIPRNPNQDYATGLVRKEVLEKIRSRIQKDTDRKYYKHYVDKMEGAVNSETVTKSGKEDDEIIHFYSTGKGRRYCHGSTRKYGNYPVLFQERRRKGHPAKPISYLYHTPQEKT